jgi:hypothetical protein
VASVDACWNRNTWPHWAIVHVLDSRPCWMPRYRDSGSHHANFHRRVSQQRWAAFKRAKLVITCQRYIRGGDNARIPDISPCRMHSAYLAFRDDPRSPEAKPRARRRVFYQPTFTDSPPCSSFLAMKHPGELLPQSRCLC